MGSSDGHQREETLAAYGQNSMALDIWPQGPRYARPMKIGLRKPSLKKSIKARTTGRAKRAIKRKVIPGYGRKGMGWLRDPKRAAYNAVYRRTTVGLGDVLKMFK